MTLTSLTADQIAQLSLQELVKRMDDVRQQAEIERYGVTLFSQRQLTFPSPKVSDLVSTLVYTRSDESKQRRLVDAAFRFLLQVDFLMVAGGISNLVVYGNSYSAEKWTSPSHWMNAAVLGQYDIVASRIALECFFDLIHIAHVGERMPGDSKFKAFRKWIVQVDNPYQYFVGHIVKGFEFDREHRQREVHGTSRFAHNLLRLEIPDSNECNISNELTNVLLSVWRPLIEILNERRPSSIAVFDSVDEFPSKYFDSNDDEMPFEHFISDLVGKRMR